MRHHIARSYRKQWLADHYYRFFSNHDGKLAVTTCGDSAAGLIELIEQCDGDWLAIELWAADHTAETLIITDASRLASVDVISRTTAATIAAVAIRASTHIAASAGWNHLSHARMGA